MADIAQYLLTEGETADYAHASVTGWLWWALNPNSVDVGGLVSDPVEQLLDTSATEVWLAALIVALSACQGSNVRKTIICLLCSCDISPSACSNAVVDPAASRHHFSV